jgi:ubiquitin carboxyl-terminal hydrolase 7
MGDESSAAEDLAFYIAHKKSTFADVNDGIMHNDNKMDSRTANDYPVGLLNHGATCYLNSVIQTLFHCEVFKKSILSVSDENSTPIIIELKKLFIAMTYTSRAAINTRNLLTAFGWTRFDFDLLLFQLN